jgi:hypothetical protein
MLLASIAPLVIPALLAYRKRPTSFVSAATRVWPLAAIAVFLLAQTPGASGALHAVLGITVPLAILAVNGLRSLPWARLRTPLVAGTLLMGLVVPPVVKELSVARGGVGGVGGNGRFIVPGERDALAWLRHDPRPGGVVTRVYLGTIVPGATGRRTFVGNSYWSGGRLAFFFDDGATKRLFLGGLSASAARALVRKTGARFLLADCETRPGLRRDLDAIVEESHRFGCASVLLVDRRSRALPAD